MSARPNKTELSKQLVDKPMNQYAGRFGLVLARISSGGQKLDGNGLESQESRCMNKLSSLGIPYEKTFSYTQTGRADVIDRHDMQALIEYIDSHPTKKYVVAFDDLKRFARNTQAHILLRMAFRKRDVLLVSPNFTFEDTVEGEFVETVLAAQGQLESQQNRRAVIQKQTARLEKGCWPFGALKGYKIILDPLYGKLSTPTTQGLEALKPALEGFANGTFVRKIDAIRFIQSKGVWTKQKAEKYLDKFTVMLKNPFYAGLIEYIHPPLWNVSRRPGHHQGIISLETFELNQKRLRKVDLNQRIRIDTSSDFPLRGLIIHEECKGHITAAWYPGRNKKYAKYVCHTAGCPNYNQPFSAKDVEDRFNKVLKRGALKDKVDVLLKKTFDRVWKDEISKMHATEKVSEQQKRALEKKLSDLTDLILTAKSPTVRKTYEQQIETTAKEVEGIDDNSSMAIDMTIPYQTALEKASLVLKKPHIAWKKLDPQEQHGLFFFLFMEKLEYSIETGYQTAKIPYAARLFEDFATQTTLVVEMAGVKPASKEDSI